MAAGRKQSGPIPYDFAPIRRQVQQHHESGSASGSDGLHDSGGPEPNPAPSRRTQPVEARCKCLHCHTMPSERENICCKEINFAKISDFPSDSVECISQHEDFEKVCQTVPVLEVAIVMQHHVQGMNGVGELANK